jgi:PAS domain S-box-containing protein
MNPPCWFGADGDCKLQVLWKDGERVFCRAERQTDGDQATVLVVLPAVEHPAPATLDRLAHEYELKDELDGAWAVRPLELVREPGRVMLVLEDPGSEPLDRMLDRPMGVHGFLRLAIAVAEALTQVHRRGLVHKDIKPANILVNRAAREVRLTGFGIASRLPRERQAPTPPESIAGTLAYMAPEQTGRMNRSVDARSDLYALGVTLYRMLTGALPFTATDPMEWVHCHIARKPMPPAERLETIPAVVSALVMKLLAKSAEDRYQTAAGLTRDLRHCLDAWEARRRIDEFPLGEDDTPDRILIAEKLYGRTRELDALLASFDRVVKSGAPELVLVAGYSGIGKSAVVHELHKALVPPRGLFASGKFDQYKRDIPYSTLVQAFQSLVRPLLGKSELELARWRDTLLEALGPNARLMVDLVPDLNLIIGEQPPVPELSPQDAQRRFQLVFRRFIGVFARPEHPLALFLDDLQWLDAATLDLLEDLLIQTDVRHLLLIGAYRDNEVDAAHPLMHKLEAIRNEGGRVAEITLAPLASDHLGQLIADALRCEPGRAAPLTRLVHGKTAGNPFFVIQFLYALAEERLLAFDHGFSRWTWDLERIRAKGYTDNVVDLMAGKLTRLPAETRKALQLLACLGNAAGITMLSIVLGAQEERVQAALWEAVRQGLVERLDGSYRFIHDRVREAAWSLIPEASRAADHLRIGRLLAVSTPPEQREEAIFEIVNQLNRGAALITAREEREQLAEFNLIAGRRAKASTAYASALSYLIAGATLLTEDCWERRHELMFALELGRAECEFLTGALTEAERRLNVLSARAASTVERATVVCLFGDLYTTLGQNAHAIAVGLDFLRHLGIHWPPHPTEADAREEYDRIWSRPGGRSIEQLVDLPMMTDPASLATLDVLTKVFAAAMYTEANLACLAICRAVNLSLEHGNCNGSTFAYVMLGAVAGARFDDYATGYRFGRLGYELVEQRQLKSFQARVYNQFGTHVLPWTKHVKTGRDLLRRAFDVASQNGDLTFSAYPCHALTTNLLAAGDPLPEVAREVEHGLAFARKTRFRVVIDLITIQFVLIRTLRGLTPKFGSFNDAGFDELEFEQGLAGNPDLARSEFSYWTRKSQARFLAGDHASAVHAAERAQSLFWIARFVLEAAEFHFYAALAYAASCDTGASGDRESHLRALTAHYKQLEIWAASCPENFENRAALAGAEIARIDGRDADAMRLYEQAIHSARANGFIHNEALANELAAGFYAARGFEKIARVYMRDARYGYLRWGADGKVRQLDEMYPHFGESEAAPTPTGTIGAPVDHLELATVLKVLQAVSGEIVLETLIDTLMRTAIEQAGADRGLLILSRGTGPRIEAEATAGTDAVVVRLCDQPVTDSLLPETVLHHVLRTRENVILDDAATQSPLAEDPYLRQRRARSILCLPLIARTRLIGVLYLENNLTPRVFSPARSAVLKLLASQATIALENARLYRDLEQREAQVRRLVDANIIGIFLWELEGPIIEANDTFLHMVGRDREEILSGRVLWADLVPPEWRARNAQAIEEIRLTGRSQPYERECVRADGTLVPVLIGAAAFDERRDRGVAFVLDLTERKRSEEALRGAQADLTRVARLTTMGELAASIAHEINQPLTGLVNSGQACLRWLAHESPKLDEARRAVERIIRDGHRAGDVIRTVRALARNSGPEMTQVDINDAIQEVLVLMRSELRLYGISLETALSDDLEPTMGDRVQLQQVILNLVLNGVEAMSAVSRQPRLLVVRSRTDEAGDLLVAVEDSGPGLSSETRDRIFEPFFTTKSDGMGMGLSICRTIVDAHGGRLWASSRSPRGAVFQFTVPSAAKRAA